MKKKITAFATSVVTATLLTATIAPHAYAFESWGRVVSCGINWTANIQTNSTPGKDVDHTYPGVKPQHKKDGGYFATSQRNMSGAIRLGSSTDGSFSAHNGGCYCPPGRNCGH